eukprot:762727-Hanusia_phi.AAC.7
MPGGVHDASVWSEAGCARLIRFGSYDGQMSGPSILGSKKKSGNRTRGGIGLKRREEELSAQAAMFALLFDLEDYATTYRATRDAYLKAANELKLATGPYKAARDAYVAATATYTKSLYE